MGQQDIIAIMEKFSTLNIDKFELKNSEFEVKLEKKLENDSNAKILKSEKVSGEDNLICSEADETAYKEKKAVKLLNTESKLKKSENKENNCKEDDTEDINEEDLIRSPIVGTFYSAPGEDKPPFVEEGTSVKKGDVLCLLEAMKMMSEVTAPKNGVIKKCLVSNEEVVEFNKPLFILESN